ncbi:MAG: response regulator [Ignavibacteriaceae bacterium]|nr:response regulator [Ignavibacteriaceae bacterium]
MASECILIVDEDKEFLAIALDFLIVHLNLDNVVWAVSPEEAEEKLKIYNPRVVVLDLGMNKLRGEEIASIINSNPNPPIIIMSSIYDNDDYLNLTHELGADGFFRKDQLKTAIPKLIEFLKTDHIDDLFDENLEDNESKNINEKNYRDLFRDNTFLLN